MLHPTALLLVALTALSSVAAQSSVTAKPDGTIVPFTSKLPACASLCGPLFDVQGFCAPTAQNVDQNCFCSDARLQPFDTMSGTAGVAQVCGSIASSTCSASDLTAIKTWYDGYCKGKGAATTSTKGGATGTQTAGSTSKPTNAGSSGTNFGTGSSGNGGSWISTHYKWVIMIVVIFLAIVIGWIVACLLRRRYLRKKELQIEMKSPMGPPVAWGPHQMQGATGGYNYGDGVVDANRGPPLNSGGHAKEYAGAIATPAENKRESKGLRKKLRS